MRKIARLPLAIDIAALLLLAGALLVAFLPTFGNGWIWVGVLGGAALGIWLGLLSAWRRWRAAITALAAVGAWFVFGGLLAMPDANIGYVVPSLRTLLGLATGPVTAWRDMLTIAPPLGTTWNLMTVPVLLAMVAGLVGISIARRSKYPTLAWLPGTIAILAAFALGVHRSLAPLAISLGVFGVVLIWTTMQRTRARTSLVRTASTRRLPNALAGALVLGLVAGLTVLAAPRVDPQEPRFLLRDQVEQPLDLRAYPSPLQGFRANISEHDTDVLFRVEGAQPGGVIRLATLDAYDGLTYNVSNAALAGVSDFVRVGARIDAPAVGDPYQVRIEIVDYADVWLPSVGVTRDVEFEGERATELGDTLFHNAGSGTSLVTAGLRSGDVYLLDAVASVRPTDAEIRAANVGDYDVPEPEDMPERLRDLARTWTSGATSAGDALLMIEARFASTGWFSHGVDAELTASLPGHSYSRLVVLLADEEQMVGDEEQYAVAMTLMARAMGMPARVIYGYRAPEGGSGEVTGEDVGAWTEVYLSGLGWVSFNPTPDPERVLQEIQDERSPQTRPHVENPPPPPQRPEVPPPDHQMPVDPSEAPDEPQRIDITEVLRVTALVGLPALVLFGPLILILGLKNRRRRNRMNADQLAARVSGGWAELLDAARDLGAVVSPAATRSEQASTLAAAYPKLEARVDTNRLARQADASTFAPEPVSAEQASSYWNGIDLAVRGLRASVPTRQALAGRLSTRSFRKPG